MIQKLREELNQHNYSYYVLDKPTISDFEFDQKLKQLQDEYVHNFKTGFSALVESPEFLLNDLNITLVEKDLLERRFDECLTLLKRITKHNDAYSIFRKYVWLDKETQDKLATLGCEPFKGSADQLAIIVRDDLQRWSRIVKDSGAKVD